MGGQPLSVQFADDAHLPQPALHASPAKRSATLYRSGFMVQDEQNGSERMTTIIPMTNHNHPSQTQGDVVMNDITQQTPIEAEESVTAKCTVHERDQNEDSAQPNAYDVHMNGAAQGSHSQIVDPRVCTGSIASDSSKTKTDDVNTVRGKQKPKAKCRLFIKNINRNIGDNQLKTKLAKFGAVSSAKIIRDPASNASKGFGFVTFKSAKASKRAIRCMHNTSWYGQKLCVTYVSDPSDPNKDDIASIPKPPPAKRRIIPTDPRLKRKAPPPQPPQPPKVFVPPIHFPVTAAECKPPPPPPRSMMSMMKPPVVHHFSSKQSLPARHTAPKLLSISPVPQPKTNTNQSNAAIHPFITPIIPPKQFPPKQIPHNHPNTATFAPKSVHFGQRRRFMPLIIQGNARNNAIKQPPIISGSLAKFLSERMASRSQAAADAKSVPNNANMKKWNRALLLGNLPAYQPNEYHKLRFQIEQNGKTPVTAIHVLETMIASFTCCCIFDSDDEMKHAFAKLNGCVIMNQRIVCDTASKYAAELNVVLAPTIAPTETEESDTQLKSMSVSVSPPPSSTSHTVHKERKELMSRNRRKERDSRRNRSRSRHRARDQYYGRYRQRSHRGRRSLSRSRSRTRSPSVNKTVKAATKPTKKGKKSRCVVLYCSASEDTNELKPSDIARVVGGSIARIIKREEPVHGVEVMGCQLYFYVRFLSTKHAVKCLEKLKQGHQIRGCSLSVQPMDESVWNTYFAATDVDLRDRKKLLNDRK
eukprot:566341_1